MEEINEELNNQANVVSANKKLWNRFNDEFWALFFIHLIVKFIVKFLASENLEITYLPLLLVGLQMLVVLIMVWRVGYHSYLFSGKKIYLLKGLLGFFWLGVIGIFLAYFAVKLDYCKATKQVLSLRNKIVAWLLIVWAFLFMVSMIYAMYIVSSESNQISNSSITKSEWVEIVSPDKNFSMSLPSNYEFLQSDSPDSIYGYSYTASEHNNSVLYIVKYQDYQSVYASEGIESLSSSKKLDFLKEIEIKDLNNFDVTNLSSEVIKIYEYDAIRYNGVVHEDGETMNIKGVIISVDKASYSVIVLYNPDYNHNLDRVLTSLVIK